MRSGKMFDAGDVVLTQIQFTDTFEIKTRPAVILFEEFGNVVVAGITTNKSMKGIPLTKQEGAAKDSVIKLNYIFTITMAMIKRRLFSLTDDKKQAVFDGLAGRLAGLRHKPKDI